MSAFMVGDEVYAQVARFLREDRPDLLTMKYAELNLDSVSFVEILRVLNRESIRVRYPDEIDKPWMLSDDGADGAKERKYASIDPYSVHPCSAAQAARHLDCIAYQSCETPRWEKSGVGALVEKLATDIGGPHTDSLIYGKGQGHRSSCREDQSGHAICAQTGAALTWGSIPPPPPPPPFKLPDGWRDGERNAKVMRKDTLRKLAESGRLELVESYHYSDGDRDGGQRHKGSPVPVVFYADNPQYKQGTCTLRPHHLEPCRQWTNVHGTFIHLRIHSNHWMDFRVVAPSTTEARAA